MKQVSSKSKKKDVWQIILILLLAVLLLTLASSFFASALLLNKVNNLEINGIALKAERAEVRLLRNHFVLKTVKITDSAKNSVLIPEISLDGLHYLQWVFGNKIEINKLSVSSPQVNLQVPFKLPTSDSTSKAGIADYEMLFNKIELKNATISIHQHRDFVQLSGLDISLQDFRKSENKDTAQKQFDFGELEINAENFQFTFKDSLYMFSAKQLAVSSFEKNVKIKEASLVSTYSKYEIGHKTGVETDWYAIDLGAINMDGLDLDALKTDQSLQLSFVNFEKFEAEIFRDKRLPFPNKPDTKLPMDMINNLSFKLHIDSAFIKDGMVTYEEHVKDAKNAGAIEFTNLHASLFEISNNKVLIDEPTLIKADARLMGGPLLDIVFEFPNKKFPVEHHVTGSLQPTEMNIVNPFLNTNMAADIEQGKISTFRFNFLYDNDIAHGSLLLEYDNLKVNLIDREDNSVKRIKTFLINKIALHSNNQRYENNFQAGKIDFKRHKKKSVFNYWWKSLLSGIKSVITAI
ncbi:MAG: hypothetical protein M0Q90_11630 [Bacteroidales bacterium]|nr:hypothetical protein [Bacteroidales bacterium]